MSQEGEEEVQQPADSDNASIYNWKDVTNEFFESARELRLGELMHDSVFGLFEAMSAIEMMDPKMDAGMMCNQAKRKVLGLEQSVDEGEVKITDLSMDELIGIIDETLACLVTWLEGHSLAQTVFTNLYLHNPHLVEDRSLKAFCICMLKTVDIIRDRINRASVYEEEDFQPMTYGFKLATDVTDVRACGMVKEVEEEYNRLIKSTRLKQGMERDDNTEREHEMAVGVYSRLKLFRLFFSTLVAYSREKCQGIPEGQKFLGQMAELLPAIKKTIPSGIKRAEASNSPVDYKTIMGFEPLVNQRLLPPTFPRYTKIRDREEAWDYMEALMGRLNFICGVTELNNIHVVLEFFMEFSQTSPCVLSRSMLQLIFMPPNKKIFGTQSITDMLRDTIRTFIAPPALMPKSPIVNNSQAKEYIDVFLTHAVRPICAIFQITGNNRARQRDKWGHVLDELAQLQEEADKVDAYLHNILKKSDPNRQHLACFGNWVIFHTLHCMINHIQAGFELELYAVHEYHYIYWYLYECLYNWMISTLSRAETFLVEQENIMEQQQKRGGKKGKKKKNKRPLSKEVTMAQTLQSICGGYYRAIMGLELDGKLKKPKFDFDSEEVRYNHRFAPFSNVGTPPPVQYSHFKEMTELSKYDPGPSARDMYAWSCKCFQQAKIFLESMSNQNHPEVQVLSKIVKTNFIVMKLLLNGHKKDSKDPPEFEFVVHKIFPIIKLQ